LTLKSGANFKVTENKIVLMGDTFEQYMEGKDEVHFPKLTVLKIRFYNLCIIIDKQFENNF